MWAESTSYGAKIRRFLHTSPLPPAEYCTALSALSSRSALLGRLISTLGDSTRNNTEQNGTGKSITPPPLCTYPQSGTIFQIIHSWVLGDHGTEWNGTGKPYPAPSCTTEGKSGGQGTAYQTIIRAAAGFGINAIGLSLGCAIDDSYPPPPPPLCTTWSCIKVPMKVNGLERRPVLLTPRCIFSTRPWHLLFKCLCGFSVAFIIGLDYNLFIFRFPPGGFA